MLIKKLNFNLSQFCSLISNGICLVFTHTHTKIIYFYYKCNGTEIANLRKKWIFLVIAPYPSFAIPCSTLVNFFLVFISSLRSNSLAQNMVLSHPPKSLCTRVTHEIHTALYNCIRPVGIRTGAERRFGSILWRSCRRLDFFRSPRNPSSNKT